MLTLKFSLRPSFSPRSFFFHKLLNWFLKPFLVPETLDSNSLILFSIKGNKSFSIILLNPFLILSLSSLLNDLPRTCYSTCSSYINPCSSKSVNFNVIQRWLRCDILSLARHLYLKDVRNRILLLHSFHGIDVHLWVICRVKYQEVLLHCLIGVVIDAFFVETW